MPRRVLLTLLFLLSFLPLRAQRAESSLSYAEVEQLRSSAIVPSDRVLVFVDFLNMRTKKIDTLLARPRRPGREQDIHDLMEQFTDIADGLADNLDDYGKRHRDIRKALPKLLSATERWATALKSPAEDPTYSISRKLALETVSDLREETTRLIEDQRAWFVAHPPTKEENHDPIDIR